MAFGIAGAAISLGESSVKGLGMEREEVVICVWLLMAEGCEKYYSKSG